MANYGGYRTRSYNSWRSRGNGRSTRVAQYLEISTLFGPMVTAEIQRSFLDLVDDALDELFKDYGVLHGPSAEAYARRTFAAWKSGRTKLSGQTMERLVELVPPYLEPAQRIALVKSLATRYAGADGKIYKSVSINIEQPAGAFAEIDAALEAMERDDVLAHLPERVMKAATWLYDDDITGARAVLAEAARIENDVMKKQARKDIELLKRTIASGQVKTAHYSVTLPAGTLVVDAFTPSKGLLATFLGWLG